MTTIIFILILVVLLTAFFSYITLQRLKSESPYQQAVGVCDIATIEASHKEEQIQKAKTVGRKRFTDFVSSYEIWLATRNKRREQSFPLPLYVLNPAAFIVVQDVEGVEYLSREALVKIAKEEYCTLLNAYLSKKPRLGILLENFQ